MMKRTLLLCLVSCVAAAAGGCACGPCMMAPFGPGTVCDSSGGCCGPCGVTACESTCGPTACGTTCETGCSDCDCGGSCSEPCETVCDQCAGASCNACCPPVGLLTWLFGPLFQGYCGDGCGEVWWGDWHGAPPDCCDPCDRCGNYTGRGAPACESCGTQYSGEVHRAAGMHVGTARANRNVTGAHVSVSPTVSQINSGSTQYAPRLVSVSD